MALPALIRLGSTPGGDAVYKIDIRDGYGAFVAPLLQMGDPPVIVLLPLVKSNVRAIVRATAAISSYAVDISIKPHEDILLDGGDFCFYNAGTLVQLETESPITALRIYRVSGVKSFKAMVSVALRGRDGHREGDGWD